MATKQLDALVSSGLIGALKYEMDMLTSPLKQRAAVKAEHIETLRELIDLACKAQRSHLSKAEKARFGIKGRGRTSRRSRNVR